MKKSRTFKSYHLKPKPSPPNLHTSQYLQAIRLFLTTQPGTPWDHQGCGRTQMILSLAQETQILDLIRQKMTRNPMTWKVGNSCTNVLIALCQASLGHIGRWLLVFFGPPIDFGGPGVSVFNRRQRHGFCTYDLSSNKDVIKSVLAQKVYLCHKDIISLKLTLPLKIGPKSHFIFQASIFRGFCC